MAVEKLPSLEEITEQLEKGIKAKHGGKLPTLAAVVDPPEEAETETEEQTTEETAKPSEEVMADAAEEPAETAADETPAEVVEPPKKDPSASRFAALSRRDKELRAKAEEVSRKEEEFSRRIREFEAREAALKKINSPLEALKAHNYSYQDATSAMLGEPYKEVDPIDQKVNARLDPVAQKQAELDEKLNNVNSALAQLQQERAEQAERELKYAIQATARDGGYEYIQALGDEAYSMVQETMVEYWKAHKQPLSYKSACDRIEAYYEERADKLLSTGKMKSRYVPTDPKTAPAKQGSPGAPAKTLTQAHSAGTRTKPNVDEMSPKDAREYLAKTMLKYK